MKPIKRLWEDKVSLSLFLLFVFGTIGFFTKELNVTAMLGPFGALYIMFQVNEKGKFFDKLRADHDTVASEMGVGGIFKYRPTIFARIINLIMLLGFIFMLGLVAYKFIF